MEFLDKAILQDEHCDWSIGTPKGARILRNVGTVARFFPIDEPVQCVGSGDGTEVLAWGILGYRAYGVDISQSKAVYANSRGAVTECRDVEKHRTFPRRNIYCAHTLEHMKDPQCFVDWAISHAPSVACFIIPIEINGTRNPSHLAPFASLDQLKIKRGEVVYKVEHFNDEPEGIIIIKPEEVT